MPPYIYAGLTILSAGKVIRPHRTKKNDVKGRKVIARVFTRQELE